MRLLCLGDGMEMRSASEGRGQDQLQPEATRPQAVGQPAVRSLGCPPPASPGHTGLQRGLWLPAPIHEQQS